MAIGRIGHLLVGAAMTAYASAAAAQSSSTVPPADQADNSVRPGAATGAAPSQPSKGPTTQDASRQAAPPDAAGVGDIIVTAQKRSQSINSVGLTITAASADTLLERGVVNTADLGKIAPGFTYTEAIAATPVYTLRGIGLYDYGLASTPSVAIYVDEIALPSPVMTPGATLDLERVEVLKGPQGTLFGESSTGGAINYIAAKPTSTFQTGGNLSIERFGRVDVNGYVSGPLGDRLKARLAFRAVEGGDWQYSVTRPGDKNGKKDQLFGRLLLDYEASDKLKFRINANGWRDRSDLPQSQFISNQLNIVAAPDARDPYARVDPAAYNAITNPASPGFDGSFVGRQNTVFNRAAAGEVGARNYLAGPNGDGSTVAENARAAEWSSALPTSSNDSFYQLSLRGDYKVSDRITLTSLTAFERVQIDRFTDGDGTTAQGLDTNLTGVSKTFSQELRLAGASSRFNWIVGGNYSHTNSTDNVQYNIFDLSLNEVLPGLRFQQTQSNNRQEVNNYAAFANADFKITSGLTFLAGIRYTNSKRDAFNCNSDITPGQVISNTFGNSVVVPGFGFYDLQTVFGLSPAGHRIVGPGQCYALNDVAAPTDPNFLRPTIKPFEQRLNEDNVSFRVGLNYKFDQGALLYATVSQGYKAGIISGVSASTTSQFAPAVQEKVVAYEAGFKAPLFDRKVQFNGAFFYYDYSNKQVRSRVRDPIFGLLETLVNVPKSRIWGLEGEVVARPIDGLALSLSGTYLNSKVTGTFTNVPNASGVPRPVYNQAGNTGDFAGSPLPYTPEFSGVFDGQYEFPAFTNKKLFVGTTVSYQSRDNTTFYTNTLLADGYFRRERTLVDLRAGVSGNNGAWRATFYGRNIFNKFYEESIYSQVDTRYRYVGRPATYGITISLKTN